MIRCLQRRRKSCGKRLFVRRKRFANRNSRRENKNREMGKGGLIMKAKILATSGRQPGLIRKTKHAMSVFIAAGFLALATGCASDHPQRTAGQSIDDQAIARRVQEA